MSATASIAFLLAQASAAAPSPGSSQTYHPFLNPLPVWDAWYILILPLCLGVSIVYKAIKCRSMREVPKQAVLITLWILGGMCVAALLLALFVELH